MIIKSMSRKDKSFSQLYDYLTREENSFSFTRNTYSNSRNKNELIREFLDNAKHLKNSRGKNYIYHELLSLEQNNLSIHKQKEILLDLANKYLEARAENHLSFAVLHQDKDNIHIHLMISANEIEKDRRVRLSKKKFSFIQKHLENYKNQKYKELSKTKLYQKEKDLEKTKQKEQEIRHRRKKQTKKEKIIEDLEVLLKKAASRTSLEKTLLNNGYELYTRAKNIGVVFESKKYRLKTLGLEELYNSKMNELDKRRQREIRRDKQKEDRSFNRQRKNEFEDRNFSR